MLKLNKEQIKIIKNLEHGNFKSFKQFHNPKTVLIEDCFKGELTVLCTFHKTNEKTAKDWLNDYLNDKFLKRDFTKEIKAYQDYNCKFLNEWVCSQITFKI